MLRVARAFPACALDVWLPFAVELLHRYGWTPARVERTPQHVQPQAMMLGIVVHLAQQHDVVAGKTVFPRMTRRCSRATVEPADQAQGG